MNVEHHVFVKAPSGLTTEIVDLIHASAVGLLFHKELRVQVFPRFTLCWFRPKPLWPPVRAAPSSQDFRQLRSLALMRPIVSLSGLTISDRLICNCTRYDWPRGLFLPQTDEGGGNQSDTCVSNI